MDPDEKGFDLRREDSRLHGYFLFHHESFVTRGEGWDPPVTDEKNTGQWHQQYHLRFTPAAMIAERNLGVLLCPVQPGQSLPEVVRERKGEVEMARVGGATLLVNQGAVLDLDGRQSDAAAAIRIGAQIYEIRNDGITKI